MQPSLTRAKHQKRAIHAHGAEHCRRDCGAVFRVFGRAHHAVVVGFEEGADDGEDYDCEAGYDDAGAECVSGGRREGSGRRMVYHVQALKADTTGFIVAEVAYRSAWRDVEVFVLRFECALSRCY